MSRNFRLASILFVALFAVIVSCSSGDEPTPAGTAITSQALVGIKDSLGFGTDDDGVLVTAVAVENDSRCAEGVQCVRAGEAFVVLSTTVDGKEAVESRLEMVPGGQASVDVDRVTVTVLELLPDPPPVGGVLERDYTLFIRIEEN